MVFPNYFVPNYMITRLGANYLFLLCSVSDLLDFITPDQYSKVNDAHRKQRRTKVDTFFLLLSAFIPDPNASPKFRHKY